MGSSTCTTRSGLRPSHAHSSTYHCSGLLLRLSISILCPIDAQAYCRASPTPPLTVAARSGLRQSRGSSSVDNCLGMLLRLVCNVESVGAATLVPGSRCTRSAVRGSKCDAPAPMAHGDRTTPRVMTPPTPTGQGGRTPVVGGPYGMFFFTFLYSKTNISYVSSLKKVMRKI